MANTRMISPIVYLVIDESLVLRFGDSMRIYEYYYSQLPITVSTDDWHVYRVVLPGSIVFSGCWMFVIPLLSITKVYLNNASWPLLHIFVKSALYLLMSSAGMMLT